MTDAYIRFRLDNHGFVNQVAIPSTAVSLTTSQAVKDANHTIYVQKIHLSITTHADGKTLDVQDDNGTPVLIARVLDDAEGDSTYGGDYREWDFGPSGIALTAGKNLQYLANTAGSGFVGQLMIYGYQKRTVVGAP